jgi:hypothetical protein
VQIAKHILILALCVCLASEVAFGQRSNGQRRHSRSKLNFKTPKVRGHKAKTICPVFENTGYPYHGIGFKVGDPLALTYKYYPSKKFSVAIDFGKASSGLYNRYYREKFDVYANEGADTLSDNSSLSYSFHRLKSDWVGEAKVLYHFEGDKISAGLQVYLGAGWEWKSAQISYDFFYNQTTPNGGELINEFRKADRRRFTMGPQVVLGIEYSYFQLPLSAFMEVEYFTDIQADPGWRRFEGGVGLRYVF